MSNLLEPLNLGALSLSNRIVMAPLTRTRASDDRVPTDLMRRYYCQRASAGLIVTEATSVSPEGVGYAQTPGIWSSAQVEGWSRITDAVHGRGGRIVLQLWHVGRVSDPEHLSGGMPVAPSAIACEGEVSLLRPRRPYVVPRALHTEEIAAVVADFGQAARHAKQAGFDGVTVHAANGYLIDQFLHDGSNQRQDAYGGSIENRCRLLNEVLEACIGVWGAGRVGVHLSPRGQAHGMHDSDPNALFLHVADSLRVQEPAFLFVREPAGPDALLPQIKARFGGMVVANEGYDADRAAEVLARGWADAVAFGRPYISNPDLVERLRQGLAWQSWDATTFYEGGARGYVDYHIVADGAEARC